MLPLLALLVLACTGPTTTVGADTGQTDTAVSTDSGGNTGGDTAGSTDSGGNAGDTAGSTDSAGNTGDTGAADTAATDSGGTTDTAALPSCGDGTCDASESCWDCAADCGACDCPQPVEVVVYTESAWTTLADAMEANPSPCADYYFSLPAYANHKQDPRGSGQPEGIRALGPRMHAMAELHWTTWAQVAGSWYDKGVAFRQKMAAAGYDVASGDTWAVNELPSSVRTNSTVQAEALDLFRGLYDGPAGGPHVKGAVFIIGMGQGTQNFSVYKPAMEGWLGDDAFWTSASNTVRWWAQETYADPAWTCEPNTTTAQRSASINAYVEHVYSLADAGGSHSDVARAWLDGAYVPLMNAVWGSSSGGYGHTDISLDEMEHHVSGEVYAARAWSNSHAVPDGRIGFAWAQESGVDSADLAVLAQRLAVSIRYAYDAGGGSAPKACSPTGAFTWCQCSVAGAQLNDGWSTFFTW